MTSKVARWLGISMTRPSIPRLSRLSTPSATESGRRSGTVASAMVYPCLRAAWSTLKSRRAGPLRDAPTTSIPMVWVRWLANARAATFGR